MEWGKANRLTLLKELFSFLWLHGMGEIIACKHKKEEKSFHTHFLYTHRCIHLKTLKTKKSRTHFCHNSNKEQKLRTWKLFQMNTTCLKLLQKCMVLFFLTSFTICTKRDVRKKFQIFRVRYEKVFLGKTTDKHGIRKNWYKNGNNKHIEHQQEHKKRVLFERDGKILDNIMKF